MLTRLLHRGTDREQGAIMVMATLLLVVMLGVSALVVDVGYGLQKRRQVQNSADAAALAAAQDLPNLTEAVATAQSNSSTNLAGGTFNWSTCKDPKHLAIVSSASECISFDTSFTQVRVRIPDQTYKTLFAKVLGIQTITTNGAASARVIGAGFASIQPFSLFSGFGAGIACLKQGPSGHRISTCDEPETGNFNLLDVTQYGNASLGTPRQCGNSAQRSRMIDNIAIGSDHMFEVWEGGVEHLDACDVPGPDTIPPRTGNDIDAFDLGLVHGDADTVSDGGGGRLQRGMYQKATIMGVQLDNKPLWEFIPDQTLPDVPTTCQRSTFEALLTTTPVAEQQAVMSAALEQCVNDYEAGGFTGEVFSANTDPFGKEIPVDLFDIQLSPRLVYIPQFVQGGPPPGASDEYNIESFRAVYMHEVFSGCSSRGECDVEFAPGPWNTGGMGAANDKAAAMDAVVIPNNMLPSGLRGNPSSIGQNNFVQLVD